MKLEIGSVVTNATKPGLEGIIQGLNMDGKPGLYLVQWDGEVQPQREWSTCLIAKPPYTCDPDKPVVFWPMSGALKEMEARIYRTLAQAMRTGYVPGYHSMGGPQDGDSIPESFDSERAADELDAAAAELEKK